jgi:F-type H+-transporting ATPase subunit a
MPEQLWFTGFLNHRFAGPVAGLLRTLHIEPHHPQAPITDSVAMEFLVFSVLVVVFAVTRFQLSVDRPSALQHAFEGLHGFIQEQGEDVIGHGSEGFTPFLMVLTLFILLCNLIGLIPGLESPTALAIVPLGCALCTFAYYHGHGFRRHGIAYLKHFAGPIPALAIVMVPVELLSHLARVLSLTVRLYANMFAGDLVTLVFFSLIPIGIPVLFLGLHLFVSILQTYIFVLLTTVYLAGAVAEEH